MKQNIWSKRMGAMALAGLLSVGAVAAAAGLPTGGAGREKALELALEDAGLRSSQVTKTEVDRDREDGRDVYEVEFHHNGTEYDYTLDADDGSILQVEREREDPEDEPSPAGEKAEIGEDQALAQVLRRAGLKKAQVSDIEVELDRGDGRLVYEVEFRRGGVEYEAEVDAATGEVTDYEEDADDEDDDDWDDDRDDWGDEDD